VSSPRNHFRYNRQTDLNDLTEDICLIERHATSVVCIYLGGSLHIERLSGGPLHESHLQRSIMQLLPEGGPCVFRHHRSADHAHVHLPGALMAHVAAAMGRRTSDLIPQLLINDETVSRLSLLLLEDTEAGGISGRLYTESLCTALIAQLLTNYGSGQHPPRWAAQLPNGLLRRVTCYLEAHLEESPSVEELGRLVGLSTAHFSGLFRRATGLSPHRFLVGRRVDRARELLVSGSDSIAQVAIQAGFYDQSHLTKQMRHVLGVSPGCLRRMHKRFS